MCKIDLNKYVLLSVIQTVSILSLPFLSLVPVDESQICHWSITILFRWYGLLDYLSHWICKHTNWLASHTSFFHLSTSFPSNWFSITFPLASTKHTFLYRGTVNFLSEKNEVIISIQLLLRICKSFEPSYSMYLLYSNLRIERTNFQFFAYLSRPGLSAFV